MQPSPDTQISLGKILKEKHKGELHTETLTHSHITKYLKTPRGPQPLAAGCIFSLRENYVICKCLKRQGVRRGGRKGEDGRQEVRKDMRDGIPGGAAQRAVAL